MHFQQPPHGAPGLIGALAQHVPHGLLVQHCRNGGTHEFTACGCETPIAAQAAACIFARVQRHPDHFHGLQVRVPFLHDFPINVAVACDQHNGGSACFRQWLLSMTTVHGGKLVRVLDFIVVCRSRRGLEVGICIFHANTGHARMLHNPVSTCPYRSSIVPRQQLVEERNGFSAGFGSISWRARGGHGTTRRVHACQVIGAFQEIRHACVGRAVQEIALDIGEFDFLVVQGACIHQTNGH